MAPQTNVMNNNMSFAKSRLLNVIYGLTSYSRNDFVDEGHTGGATTFSSYFSFYGLYYTLFPLLPPQNLVAYGA